MIDWRILTPMRFATGGTILACRLALEQGLSINLGGGYHHAASAWGGGFCVYSDVALAAKLLHDEGKLARVLVVDLDAHQGNGTASVFQPWPWAAIFDVYQAAIFPTRKEPEDYPFPVRSGLAGPEYLGIVADNLPVALDHDRPDLVIYNAGSDPFVDDPLAGFRLTSSEIAERDMLVVNLARELRDSTGDGAFGRIFHRILAHSRRQHRRNRHAVRLELIVSRGRFTRFPEAVSPTNHQRFQWFLSWIVSGLS